MRKPAFSMRARISPVSFRPTASGLTIDSVLSTAMIILLGLRVRLFSDRGGKSFADVGRALHAMNSRGGHGFVFFFRCSGATANDRAGVAHAAARRRGLS